MEFYVYIYLDPTKPGNYIYKDLIFQYEPFYVGIGKGGRYLSHIKESYNKNNNLKLNKIRKILKLGLTPLIIKIYNNITREEVIKIEIDIITFFGKKIDNGILTNITDGGDGGITWVNKHHNKGKKLEEIVGKFKAEKIKKKLSDLGKLRVGNLNSNYGNHKLSGINHWNYSLKLSNQTKNKISESLKKYYNRLSCDDKKNIILKQKNSRNNKTENEKIIINEKISKKLKGRKFTEEHKLKIKNNNYKKINKGSDKLKLSDETKKKISNSTKGKKLSLEHTSKLRKYYTYGEWKLLIIDFIINNKIKSITEYRLICNKIDNKMPPKPEFSFKRHNWCGWVEYKKYFKMNKLDNPDDCIACGS